MAFRWTKKFLENTWKRMTRIAFSLLIILGITLYFLAKHISEPVEVVLRPIVVEKSPYLTEKEVNCLATAIYYEARGESALGKKAVATVVMNRVYSEEFPSTPCNVVYQKRGSTCQFSWVCDFEVGPEDSKFTLEIRDMALRVIKDDTRLPIEAVFFHGVQLGIIWENRYTYLGRIGDHYFYSL